MDAIPYDENAEALARLVDEAREEADARRYVAPELDGVSEDILEIFHEQAAGDRQLAADLLWSDPEDDSDSPSAHIATTKDNFETGSGLVAHRGVLHPDEREWLDDRELIGAVEHRLGHDIETLRALYSRPGRPSRAQLEVREAVDARLLAIHESGGNLTELARIIGMDIRANGECRPMARALARARRARAA